MAISVLDAANHLCEKSEWTLTQLELQKLLYLSHMIHLGFYKAPLVYGDFEAWEFGPVHPELYKIVRIYGSRTIIPTAFDCNPLPLCRERETLDLVYDSPIGLSSASKLIGITHWEDGAWAKNYIRGGKGVVIPQDDIIKEFHKRKEFRLSKNEG